MGAGDQSSERGFKVFYAEKKWGYSSLIEIFSYVNPTAIYINGIYSLNAVVMPLILKKKYAKRAKLILCPRGMLLKNALSVKAFKKKILPAAYLSEKRLRKIGVV